MDRETVAILLNAIFLVAFAAFAAYMADRQKQQDLEQERTELERVREKARNAPRRLLRRKVGNQDMVYQKNAP